MSEATQLATQLAADKPARLGLLDRPLVLVGLHLALAPVIRASNGAATAYFYATVLVCLYYSLRTASVAPKLYSMAYIAGAEVVWRMTRVLPFWEGAKYLVVLFGGLALLSRSKLSSRSLAGMTFILLLLPSAYSTVNVLGFSSELRKALSFNLSGPLVLAVSVAVFGSISYRELSWQRLLHCLMSPSATIAGLALVNIRAAEEITFVTEANFVTSGGYGPNQVATILGLATFCALMVALRPGKTVNLWLLAVAGWMFVQSVATFSRGGTLAAVLTVAVFLAHLVGVRRTRIGIVVAAVLTVIGLQVAMPRLDAWTGGMLERRFRDLQTTGRGDLAQHELELFKQFPILGVGPGIATHLRGLEGEIFASHTEFSRILAEHGLSGIAAVSVSVLAALLVYLGTPSTVHRGWIAAFVCWGILTMGHSAMRLALPGFVFGLAFLNWTDKRRG